MPYYVYILYSATADEFYKGITGNPEERLRRHNSGYERATCHGSPWVMLWCTEKPTRGEAMILERKLKNLSRRRTLELMLKYSNEVPGVDEMKWILHLSTC